MARLPHVAGAARDLRPAGLLRNPVLRSYGILAVSPGADRSLTHAPPTVPEWSRLWQSTCHST